ASRYLSPFPTRRSSDLAALDVVHRGQLLGISPLVAHDAQRSLLVPASGLTHQHRTRHLAIHPSGEVRDELCTVTRLVGSRTLVGHDQGQVHALVAEVGGLLQHLVLLQGAEDDGPVRGAGGSPALVVLASTLATLAAIAVL